MRRHRTAEQIEKAKEKRQKLRDIARKISNMSEPERMALIDQWPTTIEGHRLSVHNACMLLMQANGTTPTVVGGFRQWIKAGRCVRKGQHGFGIWAPIGTRKANTDEIETSHDGSPTAFIVATVFDVTQTDELNADNKPAPLSAYVANQAAAIVADYSLESEAA